MSEAPPLLLPHKVWRLVFWALVFAVTALMLMAKPPPLIDTGWDKSNHLLAFSVTTLAGMAAWQWRGPAAVRRLIIGLLAWGLTLELLQSMLPPRTGDAADWLANALGVLLGLAAYEALRRLLSGGQR